MVDYAEASIRAKRHKDTPRTAPRDDPHRCFAEQRLIVSAIVLDALKELKMAYPKTTAKHRAELESIRKQLAK